MDIGYIDIDLIAIAVGLIAGFIDSIAGGGGLITLPALLMMGLSPAASLATNKLQGSLGTLTASIKFFRSGMISFRRVIPAVIFSFCGAVLGALLIQQLDTKILNITIPLLLILFAVYFFIFSPKISDIDSHSRMDDLLFALTAGFGIGFYDGFFVE